MEDVTIYYNADCSKCRKALEMLDAKGYKPTIINYLETKPSRDELQRIARNLSISAKQMLRTNESAYALMQERYGEPNDEAALDWMSEYASLIQRPIVLIGTRGIIARPAERLLEIL